VITFAGGLHSAGRVDRVPEETVARHFGADDACDYGPRVDAAPHLKTSSGPVRDGEHRGPCQQVQRHRRDFGRVFLS